MSNDLTTTQPNDGWNDAAKDAESRILRGTLLKFGDGRWSRGKEGEPVKDGTKLVATSTACGWVKWKDGKPAEYRMRQPGQDLPERDELAISTKATGRPGRTASRFAIPGNSRVSFIWSTRSPSRVSRSRRRASAAATR